MDGDPEAAVTVDGRSPCHSLEACWCGMIGGGRPNSPPGRPPRWSDEHVAMTSLCAYSICSVDQLVVKGTRGGRPSPGAAERGHTGYNPASDSPAVGLLLPSRAAAAAAAGGRRRSGREGGATRPHRDRRHRVSTGTGRGRSGTRCTRTQGCPLILQCNMLHYLLSCKNGT